MKEFINTLFTYINIKGVSDSYSTEDGLFVVINEFDETFTINVNGVKRKISEINIQTTTSLNSSINIICYEDDELPYVDGGEVHLVPEDINNLNDFTDFLKDQMNKII